MPGCMWVSKAMTGGNAALVEVQVLSCRKASLVKDIFRPLSRQSPWHCRPCPVQSSHLAEVARSREAQTAHWSAAMQGIQVPLLLVSALSPARPAGRLSLPGQPPLSPATAPRPRQPQGTPGTGRGDHWPPGERVGGCRAGPAQFGKLAQRQWPSLSSREVPLLPNALGVLPPGHTSVSCCLCFILSVSFQVQLLGRGCQALGALAMVSYFCRHQI